MRGAERVQGTTEVTASGWCVKMASTSLHPLLAGAAQSARARGGDGVLDMMGEARGAANNRAVRIVRGDCC